MHPENGSHERQVRWIFERPFDPCGYVERAGPALEAMRRAEIIDSIEIDRNAVVITLRDGHSWRAFGHEVRVAIKADLPVTDWHVRILDQHEVDRRIRVAADDLIAGEIGELATSHGGHINVLSVTDGVVTVILGGACKGCPAAATTLHSHFDAALRRMVDGVKNIVEVAPSEDRAAQPHRLLKIFSVRNHV